MADLSLKHPRQSVSGFFRHADDSGGTHTRVRELAPRSITNQQEKTMYSRWEAAIPQAMQQHGGRNRAPVAWHAAPPLAAHQESSVQLKRGDAPAEESEDSKPPEA
jgi:hypothetical protein